MKKELLTILLMILPIAAKADAVEINGIYYNLIPKGNVAEVTSNPNYYTGSVKIPEAVTYNNVVYNVTKIGGLAFQGCSGLTSITIPNSVTSIGEWAFQYCSGLTSITIPNGVTSIDRYAFCFCTGITSITIPNSVISIGNNAFNGCTGLTSITIPNSVTSLGPGAFYNCTGLISVTIPNSITSIDAANFSGCTGLISVTIPSSVTIIDSSAFHDCSSLTSITIPNSVRTISSNAFLSCSSLTSVTIPNSVTNIGSNTFCGCLNLADVYCYAETVPNTKSDAFENSYIEYATLHVPSSSVNAYKTADPWKNFKSIVAINGGTASKCEKPSISYKNGELVFNSETEGVEYVYEITDTDIKKGYDAKVKLGVTYNISVYATKTGYDNSDIATATLCWIDANPKTEGITNGVASVRAMPVMIQSQGGVLNITGAPEGSVINVYDLSGKKVDSAISRSETTSIPTNLKSGEIGIVKIGDKSIKVVMQ